MKETNDILDKIGRRSGMIVPEGYFDNFVAKMSEALPDVVAAPEPKRTFWHRIRPYAYMAAMFAGIWCMMKMFGLLSGPGPDLTDINNYPGVMTALNDVTFVHDYIYPAVDQYELMEDLYMQSADMSDDMPLDSIPADLGIIFDDSI